MPPSNSERVTHDYQGCLLTLIYLAVVLLIVGLSGSLWLLFRVF